MNKKIEWILKVGIAGEFFGHGVFAFQGKAQWIGWIVQLLGVPHATAASLLMLIGACDFLVALLVLIYPFRAMLAWAAIWGFWTALVRPLVGGPVWDFIERWANWAAPLALLALRGIPTHKNLRDWLR